MEAKTRKIEIGGRKLIVIDDIFKPDYIRLFDHFLKSFPFKLADYDTEKSQHVLHWIHEFTADESIRNPLLSFAYSHIQSEFNHAFPEVDLRLERIHCNTVMYGDLQLPHYDITPGMTWLYYSNPIWEIDWMGETIFYESESEPIYTIFPKPGRVVIFAADILHRGGVPSRKCLQPRRSLAFKFSIK